MTEPGFDFQIIWDIGKAVLTGGTPYIENSFYPPATSYLFVIFALLPFGASYAIWLVVNGVVLVGLTRRKALGWLLYTPVMFMFAAGQVDLIFLPLITWLKHGGWKAAIAAAAFTLKPQIAVVVLPWFLIRWLLKDRELMARFVGLSIIIHGFPILIRPTVYSEWIATTAQGAGHKFGGIGLFLLADFVPIWIVVLMAFLLLTVLLNNNEMLSRATMMLINPVAAYYDAVLLVEVAPWWLLGPASLVALGTTHLLGNMNVLPNPWIGFAAIPIIAIIFQLYKSRNDEVGLVRKSSANQSARAFKVAKNAS